MIRKIWQQLTLIKMSNTLIVAGVTSKRKSFLDRDVELSLGSNPTVLELRKAYAEKEGYELDQVRVFYRRPNDNLFDDFGIEDDEFLDEINADKAGKFMAEFPHVGVFKGQVSVSLEDPNEQVEILMGTPKSFEHHILNKLKSNFHVNFPWLNNKLAIVNNEIEGVKYEVTKYLFKDKWNMIVTKNPDPGAESKWILKRKVEVGEDYVIKGVAKEYFAEKEKYAKKIPKIKEVA